MKVLLTGATGNIGREVCAALFGHDLIYVGRNAPVNAPKGRFYPLDMIIPEELTAVVQKEKPEVIIHLAGLRDKACDEAPDLARKINVEATKNLAKAAAQVGTKLFIFASTAAVYNQLQLLPTQEDQNVDPQKSYGKTKLEAEKELAKIAEKSKTTFVALRIFNVYGQHFKESLIYKLKHSTAEQPVQLFGKDIFYRDYVNLRDVVNVITSFEAYANLTGFKAINIGSGSAVSNNALVQLLTNQGFDVHYTVLESAPSYSWADISLAKKLLNFNPTPLFKE